MCVSRASAYVLAVDESSFNVFDFIHDCANSPTRTFLVSSGGFLVSLIKRSRFCAASWAVTPSRIRSISLFLPVRGSTTFARIQYFAWSRRNTPGLRVCSLFFTRKSLSAVSGPKAGPSVARGASGCEPIKLRTMDKMGSLRTCAHRRQLATRDRRPDAGCRAEAQVHGRLSSRVERRVVDDDGHGMLRRLRRAQPVVRA